MRQLVATDAATVGRLLWHGFDDVGADGFASETAARTEADDTLAGKWGPVVWPASVLACAGDVGVAVTIVVRDDAHDFKPLLAYVTTDPAARGIGLATRLIQQTLVRLDELDVHELHLAVDADNPARRLYERLGFRAA